MTEQSRDKSRNRITFIFLLSIFVILVIYVIASIYSTSISGTQYSEQKTKDILECTNFNNPISGINYNSKTNSLSFVFENYETNATITKVFFSSDLNQTVELNITNQIAKYTIKINATKEIKYHFDVCEDDIYKIEI